MRQLGFLRARLVDLLPIIRRHVYDPAVPRRGRELFAAVCEQDLEGSVAKWKDAPYNPAALPLSWLKVENPQCSQRGIGTNSSRRRLGASWNLRRNRSRGTSDSGVLARTVRALEFSQSRSSRPGTPCP